MPKKEKRGNGYISIIGPRPSGKLIFLVTLTYFASESISEEAKRLKNLAKFILMEKDNLEPTRISSVDRVPSSNISINLKNNIINSVLELHLKMFPGEFIRDINRYDFSNKRMYYEYIEYIEYIQYIAQPDMKLAIIIDSLKSQEDDDYANKFSILENELNLRIYEYRKKEYRIAVIFSIFDRPEIYNYRKKLDIFIDQKFLKTKQTFENWRKKWRCSVKYFACSAYGMIGNSSKANATVNKYGGMVIKYPELWQPFGIFEPIYWLLTGEYEENLTELMIKNKAKETHNPY